MPEPQDDLRKKRRWKCPIHGADGFAVFDDRVLMRGGYDASDTYHLLQLQRNGRMQKQARYTIVDERNDRLTSSLMTMHADSLAILQGTRCYHVALPALLSTA